MFTINLPLRQAREEQNYAPRSAKHDQNHFGIQGKCTPIGLTSLIKFSLLSNNSSRLIVLWKKSALRTFSSWQPPRQQCGGCKEKIHYQNYSRQIQFLIRLRIIDVFCSLTTWLLLHYEMTAASLLICCFYAVFDCGGINRDAAELHRLCLPVTSKWSNDL